MFFINQPIQQLFHQKQQIEMPSSSSRTYNNTNTSESRSIAATPFCKVCRDAGKPEKEYNSHFVKDQPGPNGKVVCPTLLNQSCRICGKTGHTSSYCSQYRPRRDERYIEREPRRYERDIVERECEPRRRDIVVEREPRRDYAYNSLRDDTERRECEIRERDEQYHRQQERRSKPWLQAAMKPASAPREQQERRQPYAHPHGPRVRLGLETNALCASKHAIVAPAAAPATIDIRKVELHHAASWGDEDTETPFVCDPEQMTRKFFEEEIMASLTTAKEHDFIEMCDDQDKMPFECGE